MEAQHDATSSTLEVAPHASLTLGTDSLIVLDETLSQSKPRCCGLLPSRKGLPTRAIPYFNVLWAELSQFELIIQHAQPVTKKVVRVAYVNYLIDKTLHTKAAAWLEELLERAYGTSKRRKRLKVLVNPFGGKGSAQKYWHRDIEPIFVAARCEIDVERTQYSGHAKEIAEQLDIDAYDAVACCSGDGVPHEVFNGLALKKDARRALNRVAVVQLPCGTGNALSLNLTGTDSPSLAALCAVKGIRTPLDLVSVTQADRRTISFLSQSVGIVAESDLGTDNLRWMGDTRFLWGFLVRLLGKTVYPSEIAVKAVLEDKESIRAEYSKQINGGASDERPAEDQKPEGLPPLRYGTVQDSLPPDWIMTPNPTLGNFYAGNMPWMARDANFFQAALPSDGCLDLITISGIIPRLSAARLLLDVGRGTFFDATEVQYRKVEAYRIIPHARKKVKPGEREGYISIDGEDVPFEPFQVEVHRGLGVVLSRTGKRYEAPTLV